MSCSRNLLSKRRAWKETFLRKQTSSALSHLRQAHFRRAKRRRLTQKANVSVKKIKVMSVSMTLNFDVGSYHGSVDDDGQPGGQGRLDFKENDPLDRQFYEGQWSQGQMSGQGKMVFGSGDVYEGGFQEGIPHGGGKFTYASGDVETAEWENGLRHGLSR